MPAERAAVISVIAVVMGSLFVTTYTLALSDPVPHRIPSALVGDPAAGPGPVHAVQRVAGGSLDFSRYDSRADALHAIDNQEVYAARPHGGAADALHRERGRCLGGAGAGASCRE
jgi:hypothetical protein